MVRFNNAKITILAESTQIDDEGDYIAEWSEVETIAGDVQPHTMTEEECKVCGISEMKGGVKLFLYNGIHENIKVGNRAKVDSDFTGREDLYAIMPVNSWSSHGECLLVPVENEKAEELTPTPEPEPDGEEVDG